MYANIHVKLKDSKDIIEYNLETALELNLVEIDGSILKPGEAWDLVITIRED